VLDHRAAAADLDVVRVRADLSGEPSFVEAFKREARLASSFAHPNLLQMLDCGRYRGAFVVAMELVDGLSLRRMLGARKRPLEPAAATYLAAEIAAGFLPMSSPNNRWT
jgi:serine/threonine protein kinase